MDVDSFLSEVRAGAGETIGSKIETEKSVPCEIRTEAEETVDYLNIKIEHDERYIFY
jgi:hypothetical protein